MVTRTRLQWSTVEQEQCQQQLNGASWDRFADRLAFSDDTVASVARKLQRHINQIFYEDAELEPVTDNHEVELQGYATTLVWKTPFESLYLQSKKPKTTNMNPLEALGQCSLYDFERVDVALTEGRPLPNDTYKKIHGLYTVSLLLTRYA